MKMTVIGCGYLGAIHTVYMASLGHKVVGIDVDQAKVRTLSVSKAPFHESGLEEMIAAETASGHLRFAAEPTAQNPSGTGIHFITVGTPQSDGSGSADLSYLMGTVSMLTKLLDPAKHAVVVGKSIMPMGTAHIVERKLADAAAALAWNPEFLHEGYAVEDTLCPTRLIYGLSANAGSAFRGHSTLDGTYRPVIKAGCPVIVGNFSTAELMKVAANPFLATKISFIDAMAEIYGVTGADVTVLAQVLRHDEHIKRRALGAGIGFGGDYLPRGIRAFVAHAEELNKGESMAFLKEVDAISTRGRTRMITAAEAALGGSVTGKNITILDASFKPNTSDVRSSPALDVASRLHGRGANIRVTNPIALTDATAYKPHLTVMEDMHTASTGADLIVLATGQSQLVNMDPATISPLVRSRTVVDGYNALDREA